MTGLRFLAALQVFGFHAMLGGFFASAVANTNLATISRGGWSGVSFFFILSGFVLTWVADPRDTLVMFWRRRALKILPNYWVTFVIALLLLLYVAGRTVSTGNVIFAALLVQAWVPNQETPLAVNPVAWSLSCEVLFYLLFPFLLRPIARIRPERLWWWTGGLAAVILVLPAVAGAILPANPTISLPTPTSAPLFWFLYLFPPVRLLEFVFGMLLARVVMSGRRVPLSIGGAAAVAIAVYALVPMFPVPYGYTALMALPLGLIIAATAVADSSGERRGWLASRWMVLLGELSFAFYLGHSMVLTYGHQLLGAMTTYPTPVAVGLIVLLLLVSVALSWLLFNVVERPMMRRFARSRRSPAAAVTVSETALIPHSS